MYRKAEEAKKPKEVKKSMEAKEVAVASDKNLAEWVTSSSLISTRNAEVIGDSKPTREKAKIKSQARKAQKVLPASEISPPSDNDFRSSPRKPLAQNFQRDVEPDCMELNSNDKRPKVL